MPEYGRPDIFVEEIRSQVQTIEGVSTTTAAFVIVSEKGPIDDPTLLTGFSEFTRIYGGPIKPAGFGTAYGWWAVRDFFANGGKRCYVTRVQHRNAGAITAVQSSKTLNDEQTSPVLSLTVKAKTHGVWGDRLLVGVRQNPVGSTTLSAGVSSGDTQITVGSTYGFKAGSEIKVDDGGANQRYKRVTEVIPGTPGTLKLESTIGFAFSSGATVVSDEFDLLVYERSSSTLIEAWKQVSMWASYNGIQNADYVESRVNDQNLGSDNINVAVNTSNTTVYQRHPAATLSGSVVVPLAFTGGNDGLTNFADSDVIGSSSIPSGLQTFAPIDEIAMVACPGFSGATICDGIRTFVATTRSDVFANTSTPVNQSPTQAMAYRQSTAGLDHHKMAIYYPWVKVADPLGAGKNAMISAPPEAGVMGVDARTDVARGVFKPGAGIEAVYRNALDVERMVDDPTRDLLNPLGINVIHFKRGAGIIVDGCRTLSAIPEFRYKSVVRTLIFLEESIQDGIAWAVHETNNQQLWDRLRISISAFLLERWREGYLEGATPSEGFYVKVDSSNNPQTSINEGKVIVEIGVAIVKPAEFVILRFVQWDGGRVVQEIGQAA